MQTNSNLMHESLGNTQCYAIEWYMNYPVLQASLNILTESAVIMKASAHARCPICGFGSAYYTSKKCQLIPTIQELRTFSACNRVITFTIPYIDFGMITKFP